MLNGKNKFEAAISQTIGYPAICSEKNAIVWRLAGSYRSV